jgi:8-oxo-dGTP diphosphatase
MLAGCVIVDEYGRILLLHRDAGDKSCWELPGGKVERDELPESAAVRELREELGVDVRLIRNLGSGEFEANDTEYIYHWFQAGIAAGEPELMEPDKFDDFDYFELEDMLGLALSGNMQVLLPKIASGEVALQLG